MWKATIHNDPLNLLSPYVLTQSSRKNVVHNDDDHNDIELQIPLQQNYITLCKCSLTDFLMMIGRGSDNDDIEDIRNIIQQRRIAQIAMADFIARTISSTSSLIYESYDNQDQHATVVKLDPLDRASSSSTSRSKKCSYSYYTYKGTKPIAIGQSLANTTTTNNTNNSMIPYIMERTDVAIVPSSCELHIYLRVFVYDSNNNDKAASEIVELILKCMNQFNNDLTKSFKDIMRYMAVAVFQETLRSKLHNYTSTACSDTSSNVGVVAFIANGAILPRKSGASNAPMSSPPAIPFLAPESSSMTQTIHVDMGAAVWTKYLKENLPSDAIVVDNTNISISGLLIPRGVTLIVGGGYHGKSTLLRCIASGVYNKVPHDGREFCVTVDNALTVRAEDGRYVNHCNVSAFISNLPIPDLDTKKFSTTEASGSTSQASNVVEAIEMGVSAMLVDEDVSAANFMARDGRMRSLVMDESITPLLYRVNGLYSTHGISSIVVVGGVGDWLDVPDNVILMDRYRCFDATAKARSISKTFSHGHVQYAGRGVVHRLNWEKSGTPSPRRPSTNATITNLYDVSTTSVTLLDGSNSIAINPMIDPSKIDSMCIDDNELHDDERYIDMSRCEQLLGKKPQLYGCGLCVAWLLNYSQQHPEYGIRQLLEKMDEIFDQKGWLGILQGSDSEFSIAWMVAVESLGFVFRPRRFEVGQALTRFRGITFELLPIEDDGSEEAARLEAERKRNELLAIWNNRRKRNPE